MFAFAGLVMVGVVGFAVYEPGVPAGQYEEFAQCVTDSGATMYGTYWCGHCKAQKEAFGDSFDKINYVECAIPNVQGQTEECRDAGIEGYPTWVFGDGSRVSGEMTLGRIAELTGCKLPIE